MLLRVEYEMDRQICCLLWLHFTPQMISGSCWQESYEGSKTIGSMKILDFCRVGGYH